MPAAGNKTNLKTTYARHVKIMKSTNEHDDENTPLWQATTHKQSNKQQTNGPCAHALLNSSVVVGTLITSFLIEPCITTFDLVLGSKHDCSTRFELDMASEGNTLWKHGLERIHDDEVPAALRLAQTAKTQNNNTISNNSTSAFKRHDTNETTNKTKFNRQTEITVQSVHERLCAGFWVTHLLFDELLDVDGQVLECQHTGELYRFHTVCKR